MPPVKKPSKPESPPPADNSLPDVGAPAVLEHRVGDRFSFATAFRFGFLGCGQGGSRLAQTFWELGYGRVAAINTAISDLQTVSDDIPKLDLGGQGAGKNPEQGRAAAESHRESIWDLCTRAIGDEVDYLLVCAGLGGGTGTGIAPVVLDVARKFMQERGREPKRVGAIVSLPETEEGQRVCKNAVFGFDQVYQGAPSPLIVIDNRRIGELQRVGVKDFYPTANQQVAKLLHLFNRLGAQRSELMTFDAADFATLLDSGLCVFGASPVTKYASGADLAGTIRDQLERTSLAQVQLNTGRVAACIYVGGSDILGKVPRDFFGHASSMLTRMLAPDSMVHLGIYEGESDDLRCYTMVGGLQPPKERLKQLAERGAISAFTPGMLEYLHI